MSLNLPYIDIVWNGLILGSSLATLFFVGIILSLLSLRKKTKLDLKWLMNVQILLSLSFFVASFACVALIDPQLSRSCFENFVQSGSFPTVTRWLSLLWLGGVFTLGLRDLWTHIRSSPQQKHSTPVRNSRVQRLAEDLCRDQGIKTSVSLASAAGEFSPFVHGILNPKILLPDYLLEPTAEAILKPALAHELIHLRDKDCFWILLSLTTKRLLFWHPLAYLISRLHRRQIELAADEGATSTGKVSSAALIAALVSIAEKSALRTKLTALPASQGFFELKQRIEVLSQPGRRSIRFKWLPLVLATALPLLYSASQARTYLVPSTAPIFLCDQAQHEILIQQWIKGSSPPIRSEM